MLAGPAEPVPGGWLAIVIGVLMAVGGGSGLTALVLVSRQGRKLRADTAQVLTSAAVTMIQPLEQRLQRAEEEAARTRDRLLLAEGQLQAVRAQLQHLIRAILRPEATIETVRELARRAARNGTGSET